MTGVARTSVGVALAAAALGASGCGGGSHAPASLTAVCSQAATATEAIDHKRVGAVIGRGLAEPSPASAALARGLAAAAAETLAVDRAVNVEVRVLPKSAATRAALAALGANEVRLETIPAHSSDEPIMRVFDLGEASGGCRRARKALRG